MEGKDLISGTEREKKKSRGCVGENKSGCGAARGGVVAASICLGCRQWPEVSSPTCPIPPSAALTGSGQLSPSGQLELRSTTCIAVFATTRAVGFDSARCRPAYLVIYELSYC